jgi:AAA ATPase-like protein
VAREEELAEMDRTLRGYSSRRIVVLHGLGGIGKTQLTVAYAKRHRDNYSAVFWLNIKDEDSLKQSFAKVAKQILREHKQILREHSSASQLSSVDIKENIDEAIDAVKVWLSQPNNTRWLMIYDNYDNPKLTGNTDPAAVDISLNHIRVQSSSQHGRRKSRLGIASKSKSWKMCAIVSGFYQMYRDEKDWKMV